MNCASHDHLEIACMYGYEVEITCHDSTTHTCKPITTTIDKELGEALKVKTDDNEYLIAFDNLKSMKVLTPNAKIGSIEFA